MYPISEIFDSPQGEGLYAGTMMTFIRLAGCSVGRPYPKDKALPVYQEECTLYDGRKFPCDTDYRVRERLSVGQLTDRLTLGIDHICLTGGEPMIHNLEPLIVALHALKKEVHLETSGTIKLCKAIPNTFIQKIPWITVSPKAGVLDDMIERANEIKLLVDEDFNVDHIPAKVFEHQLVFIHPVNYEHSVNPKNVRLIMELQKRRPNWRIGLQLHKVLESYIKERVR